MLLVACGCRGLMWDCGLGVQQETLTQCFFRMTLKQCQARSSILAIEREEHVSQQGYAIFDCGYCLLATQFCMNLCCLPGCHAAHSQIA